MFLLYALAAGLLLGLLLGGSLAGIGGLRFRWAGLAVGGFAIQVVLFAPPVAASVGDLGTPIYLASTLLVVAAVLGNVRQLPALWLVAVGAAANLAAIVANGGGMPALPSALEAAGRTGSTAYSNSILAPDPILPALVDRFAIPAGIPFANVFSIGDVLIGLGVAAVLIVAMRRRPTVLPARSGDGA
ncbi:MAG TPA: DUF5317 family protein [Candidatus Limnocylindrales bacterium]